MPASQYAPAGQATHSDCPLDETNLPASHAAHEALPAEAAMLPAAHALATVAPAAHAEPAGHVMQSAAALPLVLLR